MAETAEVDIDALDAAAAKKAVEKVVSSGEKTISATATDAPVVVEPHGATQKGDAVVKTADAQLITPEEGLEKLKRQLKDERDARIAAENRAKEAAQGEADARGRAQTTELDLVKQAIDSVKQASDALEGKYAEAMAAQDWANAAKVQRQMADNAAKLAQLEVGKTTLEKAPKPAPRASVDPVEAFCAKLTPRSSAWVRAHPEFVHDAHKNRQMIAAHELAIARGYTADTDDYFKSVEKTLDLTHAAHADDPDPLVDPAASAASGGRQVTPAAAPVSRSGNGAGSARPNVVRLSADEVEIAQNMGMTVEDYARHKLALKKEGKLS